MSMRRTIFARTASAVGASVAFALAAMARYPGGTPIDASSQGYSLTRNFLSDLGMTASYDGQPNRLGAACFVISLLGLLIGAGGSLHSILRIYAREPAARQLVRVAGAAALLVCAAFAGVAVTPENRVMAVHLSLTLLAWRIVPVVAGLMALASLRSSRSRRRVTVVWALLGALLLGYAVVLTWGPGTASPDGLEIQVIAQKVAALSVIAALLFLSREADRVRALGR